MINSRKIEDLKPHVAAKCREWIDLCARDGIDVIITSTLRDIEAQDCLYAQGRTIPGKIVTNAKGGDSMHNWGLAWDFVPCVYGKPVWDDKSDLWRHCGETAESIGIEWGGSWIRFPDKPHLQVTGGMSIYLLKQQAGMVA